MPRSACQMISLIVLDASLNTRRAAFDSSIDITCGLAQNFNSVGSCAVYRSADSQLWIREFIPHYYATNLGISPWKFRFQW
ncbi:hypothetical protein BD410DRAFT_1463 [Rickenella mellea]|uniref:Uncharacterized protein n=1 Tax=Rickenella mellea TaxID=50990 RepID=A0A4R5XDB1_9AGAM|nr:hypothetical protein BD410DRAFT_1463 [Rickenella mellea]